MQGKGVFNLRLKPVVRTSGSATPSRLRTDAYKGQRVEEPAKDWRQTSRTAELRGDKKVPRLRTRAIMAQDGSSTPGDTSHHGE